MTNWRFAWVGFSIDDITIGGLHVWKQEWRPVEIESLLFPHPDYPNQTHRYDVYEIGDLTRSVRSERIVQRCLGLLCSRGPERWLSPLMAILGLSVRATLTSGQK